MCNQVVTCLGGAAALANALQKIYKTEGEKQSFTGNPTSEKEIKKKRQRLISFLEQVVDNPKTACEMYGLPLSQINAMHTYRKLLIEFKLNVELTGDSPVLMPVTVLMMKEIA